MKSLYIAAAIAALAFSSVGASAQAKHHGRAHHASTHTAGSPASITVHIVGTGVATITPNNCTFAAGAGSANQPVCQFSATTVPAGGTVTWSLNGGPNASQFVMTPAGLLSVGMTDVPAQSFTIYVKATGP